MLAVLVRMFAATGLNARLFVGRDDELIFLQPPGLAIRERTSPVPGPPWWRTRDRGEKSNYGDIRAGWHLHATSATALLPLMEATRPLCWTCWTRSGVLHRDKGRSYLDGSSQARALTCTTSSGGKSRGATRTSPLFQPGKALGKEALAPRRDHFTAGIEAGGDLVVGHALGGVKDHFGLLYLKIWQRIFRRSSLQFGLFGRREERVSTSPTRCHGQALGIQANYTLSHL